MSAPRSIEWVGGLDGACRILDQTLLPGEVRFLDCRTLDEVCEAIRRLRVRGAPAIGIAAAMGAVLAVRDLPVRDSAELLRELRAASDLLIATRPTAVNLAWAVRRMTRVCQERSALPVPELKKRLLAEAVAIRDEDAAMCRKIGLHGAALIRNGDGILTHCNAGALATAEYGTALAPIFVCRERGMAVHVFVDETRPLLQGARLTAWELLAAGVEATLICDNMAGQVMKEGRVQRVFVGADRIAANGDTANKIGTYTVAILARQHGIPFYVCAPSSTFDLSIPDGSHIPIEQRGADEVTEGFGRRTAPVGIKVYSPAFDVTPAPLITAIITERGLIESPDAEKIRRHLA